MAFSFTTLFVSDMDRSLAFYRDLMGLPVSGTVAENGLNITFLGDPKGTQLELIAGDRKPEPSATLTLGFTPENIPEILRDFPGPVEGPVSPNPHLTIWIIHDPDGYGVELLDFH